MIVNNKDRGGSKKLMKKKVLLIDWYRCGKYFKIENIKIRNE